MYVISGTFSIFIFFYKYLATSYFFLKLLYAEGSSRYFTCKIIHVLIWLMSCVFPLIFQMAYELYGVLSGAVSLNTGEKVQPAYGGEPESFLTNVVTPIYNVIYEV